MKKRIISSVLALLLAASVITGCSSGSGASTETASAAAAAGNAAENEPVVTEPEIDETTTYKESIRIGTTGDLATAIPYFNAGSMTAITTNATFEGLVKIDDDGEAQPYLATSWEVNDDSTQWTFHLREGVKFQDGSDFTSEDVKFTWEYASNTDNCSWPIVGYELMESIELPDDYTVVFNMYTSVPDFLLYAAQKIMSENAVETLGADVGGAIGTGPFMMASEEPGVSWTIERFDDYWGELPVTKEITFVIMTDASARALALRAGDVDAIYDANASDIVSFLADSDYNVYKAESLSTIFLGLNCMDGAACSDQNLRTAIAMSINRDDIADACYENGACGVACYNIINDVAPGHAEIDYVEYDPEGAMALMEENGLTDITLKLSVHARFIDIAEMLQAQLAQVGINVEIRELAQSGFTNSLTSDPTAFDMFINYPSTGGGLLSILNRYFITNASASAMFYSDPEFDAMYDDAMHMNTYDEMLGAYAELQQYLADSLPAIPLIQQYSWCIGTNNFYGVYLGTETVDADFRGCYVIE